MTDKELKNLRRSDLLELLLTQSREMDRLKVQMEEMRQAAADKKIYMQKLGSIAEVSLKLNKVFEAAQASCDQYTENAHRKAEEELAAARADARDIRARARERADAYTEEARACWEKLRALGRKHPELAAEIEKADPFRGSKAGEEESGDAD